MHFALLAAGLIAGLLAARYRLVGSAAPQRINTFIINIALPAMILLSVPALRLDASAMVPVAASWSVILGSALAVWSLGTYRGWSRQSMGALLLVVPLTNSAYLGLPLLNVLTNDTVTAYGAFYDQLGNFLALSLYAPLVVAVYANTDDSDHAFSLGRTLKTLLSFVPFPVLLLSVLFLSADTLPGWTRAPLSMLASLMGPLAAFIVGFSLKFSVPKTLWEPLVAGLGLRLILGPLIALLVVSAMRPHAPGMVEPVLVASVLQAAMPSMITAGLMGIAAGFSERLIIAMISLSTLLSVGTLTALFLILT